MRKILYLINHDIVDFRTLIPSVPEDVEDVINSIHDVISSTADLPTLILTEGLINIQFFILCKEGISGGIDIGLLSEILTWILMCLSGAFDGGVDFSPDEVGSDVAGGVVLLDHPRPEMHDEIFVIYFKGEDILGLLG